MSLDGPFGMHVLPFCSDILGVIAKKMFFVHLRDLSFIWPFREANTRRLIKKKEKRNKGVELLL